MVALGMRSFLILEPLLVFRLTKHATRSLPGRCPGAAANPIYKAKPEPVWEFPADSLGN